MIKKSLSIMVAIAFFIVGSVRGEWFDKPYIAPDGRYFNKIGETVIGTHFETIEKGIKKEAKGDSPFFLEDTGPNDLVAPRKEEPIYINPVVTWIGHSTVFIQIVGFNIITDPVFGDIPEFDVIRFSFKGIGAKMSVPGFKRQVISKIKPQKLRPIDIILLSHRHRDHFDPSSLKEFVDDQPLCLVGLGLKKTFEELGFKRVKENTWWEETIVSKNCQSLKNIFVPARHWSEDNKTLWGSWIIQSRRTSIYFGGDSDYKEDLFKKIFEKFKIDIALLPIGPFDDAKMSPEQAGQVFLDLNASVLIPIHWGTFGLVEGSSLLDSINPLGKWWEENKTSLKDKKLEVLDFGGSYDWQPIGVDLLF